MRSSLVLLLGCLLCTHAHAQSASSTPAPAMPATAEPQDSDGRHRVALNSDECGLSTPFSVLVDGGGVWLYRKQGSPREIFFHAGELSVDQQVQAITAEDAQRLWQMETTARLLMPQVAGLARDSVDLSFDVLGNVVEVLTGSRRKANRLAAMHDDALAYVDGTLGIGRWDQELFDGRLDQRIEAAAEEMSGMLARSLMWQVMTGRSDAIEERADRMEAELEPRIDAATESLAAKAEALCPQVEQLYALQAALEYRYQGQPLRMIETGDAGAAVTAAAPAAPASRDDHGDHPDTAIPVSAPTH